MRWRKGQYLLFEKSIAKINKIGEKQNLSPYHYEDTTVAVKLRKWSKGKTISGYSWQHIVSVKHLDVLYNRDAVRIISPEEVMRVLFYFFEKNMPIGNVNEV